MAALGLCAIAYATLCPIGLRPHLASANVERFGAYLVLGVLSAMTFRRDWKLAIGAVVFAAVGLEAAQLLVHGRDARVEDATVKAIGGVIGSCVGYASFPLRRLWVGFVAQGERLEARHYRLRSRPF
jgi:hypothetical protein